MKLINKVYYTLDEEDKKDIKKQMIDLELSLNQMAKNLNVSPSYLTDVINGKKNFTPKLKEQFKSQKIIIKENKIKMKVYVVKEICDYEYYCRDVVFVTLNEDIAKQYCEEHNVKDIGWDEKERDTVIYEEYETKE